MSSSWGMDRDMACVSCASRSRLLFLRPKLIVLIPDQLYIK